MTTLADDFARAAADARSYMAKNGHRPEVEGVLRFADKIGQAQRFMLTEGVRDAVSDLLKSKPKSICDAISFARPPFGLCWFERRIASTDEVRQGQIPAAKAGVLVEALDDNCASYRVTSGWRFSETALNNTRGDYLSGLPRELRGFALLGVSITAIGVDTDGDHSDRFARADGWGLPHATQNAMIGDTDRAAYDEDDRAAAMTLSSRVRGGLNPDSMGTKAIVNSALNDGTVDAKTLAANLRSDVEDEMGLILGTLILINARNGADTVAVDPPHKLNRARIRRGEVPILGYSEVRIKLNQGSARALERGDVEHSAIRRHIVRGHFKVRKSGVYWWHPHLRGSLDAGLLGRAGHKVEA